jgi:hypothetical protein
MRFKADVGVGERGNAKMSICSREGFSEERFPGPKNSNNLLAAEPQRENDPACEEFFCQRLTNFTSVEAAAQATTKDLFK